MRVIPVNIGTLTPLRGFAAILVSVYHFNYAFIITPPGGYTFINKCYLMVDLFFIMSGFIMMHVYQHIFSNKVESNSFKKFILARFARIYPLHFFMLFLFVVLIYLGGHGNRNNPVYAPSAIITNVLLLQSCGFHSTGTWNVSSWSISAEWWAYMIFPFVCFFLFRKRLLSVVTIIFTIIFIYFMILYYLPRPGIIADNTNINVSYNYGYLRGIAGFLSGMLLYLLYQKQQIKNIFKNDLPAIISLIALIVAMQADLFDLYCLPILLILVMSFACNEGGVHKTADLKPLQWIGDISYSFYLTHELMILLAIQALKFSKVGYDGPLIHGIFKGLPFIIIFIVLVSFISYLTFNFIEKPARDWINYNLNKKKIAAVKA